MANKNTINTIQKLLKDEIDVEINGLRSFDIRVNNELFWDMVIKTGSLGFGEAYMKGYWDCDDLEELFFRILSSKLMDRFGKIVNISNIIDLIRIKLKNYDSFEVGKVHYDIGNDLYELMLGSTLAYSCGYFKDTDKLDTAQNQKFDLICQKLDLKKGETLLDIGCGWGTLMKYAVKNYGVTAVGLTVSVEQKNKIEEEKNPNLTVILADYQKVDLSKLVKKKFDKIVSVGMFEHVNRSNYNNFMSFVDENLQDGGLFLLHTIGDNKSTDTIEPWIEKYIFPNSKLPSMEEIIRSSQGKFVLEDIHNFGMYYHYTLKCWYNNFKKHWNKLKNKYNKNEFYRMWTYYLNSCSGSFKARHIQLWQIVYSKKRNILYNSVR